MPLPVPIKVFRQSFCPKLNGKDSILSYRDTLKNKGGGIYCFINTVDNKQYIGSAKDLYIRLIEHLTKKSRMLRYKEQLKNMVVECQRQVRLVYIVGCLRLS